MFAASAVIGVDAGVVVFRVAFVWLRGRPRGWVQFIVIPILAWGSAIIGLLVTALDFWAQSPAMNWNIFQVREILFAYLGYHLTSLLVWWLYRDPVYVD